MEYNDVKNQKSESTIAKMVMERIRKEDPWAFAHVNPLFQISLRAVRMLTVLGFLLLTLSLILLLAGLNGKVGTEDSNNTTYSINQVTGVGEIGYADSTTSSTSLSIDTMVASIGDAFMITGDYGKKSLNFPLLISVFIFFEALLLLNWITRFSKH